MMHISASVLLFLCVPIAGDSTMNNGIIPVRRNLQIGNFGQQPEDSSTTTTTTVNNFRATYKARFQHLVDAHCEGPEPIVQVFCFGDIAPVSISDASLQCSAIARDEWSGIQCTTATTTTTAVAAATEAVYLERTTLGGSNFGEIVFHCEGQAIADVDAYMNYLGGEDGSCEAKAEEPKRSNNFHVGQLGVFCANLGDGGDYWFDHSGFECSFGSNVLRVEDIYTCTAGENCAGEACVVDYGDLIIEADRQKFHDCVEKVGNEDLPEEPSREDLISPAAEGQYLATFQANWQLSLDTTICGGDFATKRINCTNGKIALIESLASNVNCTTISESVMECNDNNIAENFVNEFSGVVFTCESTDAVPEVQVDYLPANAVCQGSDTNSVVHYIQLGVNCSENMEQSTSYADYLFECGKNNTYEVLNGRYTCASAEVFEPSDLAVRPMRVASVYTDFRWSQAGFDLCYQYTPSTSGGSSTEPPCESGNSLGLGIGIGSVSSNCADTPENEAANADQGTAATPGPTLALVTAAPEPVTAAPEPTSAPTDSATIAESATKPVVPGTTYYVDYKARFKRVIDDGCEGPSTDAVIITCEKGSLEVVATSDPSIFCTKPEDFDGQGEVVTCMSRCQGAACDSVYIDRDSLFIQDVWVLDENLYAEIEFRCSQVDDVNGVDALYWIPGSQTNGETGSCSGEGSGSGQNFLIAELNVKCDDGTGESVYVNDDAFYECASDNIPLNVNGAYSCLAGDICQSSSCLVSYNEVFVSADHHLFTQCIQTDNDSGIPEPEVPTGEAPAAGLYSAVFQVGKGYWYDTDSCTGTNPGLKIQCVDGTIELIEGGADTSCNVTSESEILCTEDENSLINEHVDVAIYKCTAVNKIPTTHIEYYAADLTCDSSSVVRASRWLNLGVRCGDPGDETFASLDYFLECGVDNTYDTTTDDSRFSCSSTLTIPGNSFGLPNTIAPVEVYTDYRWAFFSSDRCYTVKVGSTKSQSMIDDFAKKELPSSGETSSSSSSGLTGTGSDSNKLQTNRGQSAAAPAAFGFSFKRSLFLVATILASAILA